MENTTLQQPTLNHETINALIKDIEGNPIKVGDRFSFTFIGQLDGNFDLEGTFIFNQDELRYEIDVYENNHRFVVLSYNPRVMTNFKLLN